MQETLQALKKAIETHAQAAVERLREKGGVGGYNPPVFKPGIHGPPHCPAFGDRCSNLEPRSRAKARILQPSSTR